MAWLRMPALSAVLSVVASAVLLALFLADAARGAEPAVSVRTREGLVTGVSEGDIRVLKAIPYAAPPVGDLRDGSSLRINPETYMAGVPASVRATYGGATNLARAIYTDGHVAAPARWIATRAERGAPAYLYYFSHVRAAQRPTSLGAAHGAELPYVMNRALPALADDEERRVTAMVHSRWVSFARTDRPVYEGAPAWPAYRRMSDQVMELSATPQVRSRLHRERLDAHEAAMAENLSGQREELERLTAAAR